MKIPRRKKDILAKYYIEYLEYIKTEPKEDKEIIKNTIKIFYRINDEELNKFEYHTILDMFKIIENILKIEQPLVPIFKLNDIEYGINPNFDDMTFAEMIDCDTTDILKQISILYRTIENKKGTKYTVVKYEADISNYDELKENLTLDVYLGFIGFFLKINKDILNYTLNYLTEKGMDQEKRKVLEQSGVGFHGYMNYAMEI